MPHYFYHLKFELYPHAERATTKSKISRRKEQTQKPKDKVADESKEVWLPGRDIDIFDSEKWPRHRAVNETPSTGTRRTSYGFAAGKQDKSIRGLPKSVGGVAPAVIDCGTSRAIHLVDEDGEALIQPIASSADLDFPPPSPNLLSGNFDTARRDWRFGRVRVESWDTSTTSSLSSRQEEQQAMAGRPTHRRGESSSALSALVVGSAAEAGQGNGINAGLTTSATDRVTKARFEEGKNTEIGWGVVHLYRDGEESSFRDVEVYNSTTTMKNEDSMAEDGEGKEKQDYTTLCIPAVPSYLTPSDFLGFVGEKTRELVSHFRMVMTGRMNRYLVLMKFRDGDAARKWKDEWDGKVFNSMEVCVLLFIYASVC